MAAERAEHRPLRRRRDVIALAVLAAVLTLAVFAVGLIAAMPGRSFRAPLPAATPQHARLALELKGDVAELAGSIGERNLRHPQALRSALRAARRARASSVVPRVASRWLRRALCRTVMVGCPSVHPARTSRP